METLQRQGFKGVQVDRHGQTLLRQGVKGVRVGMDKYTELHL